MRQIVAACWTAKREEGAGAGGGRRHGGTEGGAGGRGRSLEVVEKERKGDGRDALYRGVMDASRGWFRLGLAATSVKVIVIGGTGEREIYSLRVDFFSFPPFFFFFSTPVVSATVLYTDNWWNGSMHFFFSSQKFIRCSEFSSLSLKYIFKVGVVILYSL